MTALRWFQAHWLPVLVGAFLASVIFQFLTRATPLQPAAAVGFMLSAILGGCLFVLFVGNAIRIDEVDERLTSLEQHLAAEPEPEVGGWPEEEPNPVEPPDEAVTDEFPAITEPMPLGDEIEADFRAHQVHAEQAQTARRQMVEKTVGGMTFRVMEDVP